MNPSFLSPFNCTLLLEHFPSRPACRHFYAIFCPILKAILTFYGLTNINSERKHLARARARYCRLDKAHNATAACTPSRNYLHYHPRDAPTRRGVFSQHIRATAPLRGRGGGSDDNFQREYFPRDETAPNAMRERVPRESLQPRSPSPPPAVNALSYIFHYVPQDFPRPRESAPAARVNWRLSSRQGRRGGGGPGGRGGIRF